MPLKSVNPASTRMIFTAYFLLQLQDQIQLFTRQFLLQVLQLLNQTMSDAMARIHQARIPQLDVEMRRDSEDLLGDMDTPIPNNFNIPVQGIIKNTTVEPQGVDGMEALYVDKGKARDEGEEEL